MDYVYGFLGAIGLDTMFKRFLFGAVVAAAVVYWTKPWFSFYTGSKEGDSPQLRPWVFTAGEGAQMPTYLPFLAIPILAGLVFALFV